MTPEEEKEREKMFLLLRRVYDVIEMSHLTDNKLVKHYVREIKFPRKLGDDIFNYLQSKDQKFKDIVIKRQQRYRRRIKQLNSKN